MPYRIAGIDVHKKMFAVVVADVEVDGEFDFERQKAGTTPTDLRRLADWLVEHEVEEVIERFSTLAHPRSGVDSSIFDRFARVSRGRSLDELCALAIRRLDFEIGLTRLLRMLSGAADVDEQSLTLTRRNIVKRMLGNRRLADR